MIHVETVYETASLALVIHISNSPVICLLWAWPVQQELQSWLEELFKPMVTSFVCNEHGKSENEIMTLKICGLLVFLKSHNALLRVSVKQPQRGVCKACCRERLTFHNNK